MALSFTTITPTQSSYTIYVNAVATKPKGFHFLVNYIRGTGTETSISILQQFRFRNDTGYRTRDYLDSANVRQNAIELVEDAVKDFFVSVPNIMSCDSIRLDFTFTGYTTGSYGLLQVVHVEEIDEVP